jgi:hypothetical protein
VSACNFILKGSSYILLGLTRKRPAATQETPQDGGLEGGSSKRTRFKSLTLSAKGSDMSDNDDTQGMFTLSDSLSN